MAHTGMRHSTGPASRVCHARPLSTSCRSFLRSRLWRSSGWYLACELRLILPYRSSFRATLCTCRSFPKRTDRRLAPHTIHHLQYRVLFLLHTLTLWSHFDTWRRDYCAVSHWCDLSYTTATGGSWSAASVTSSSSATLSLPWCPGPTCSVGACLAGAPLAWTVEYAANYCPMSSLTWTHPLQGLISSIRVASWPS